MVSGWFGRNVYPSVSSEDLGFGRSSHIPDRSRRSRMRNAMENNDANTKRIEMEGFPVCIITSCIVS